MKNKIPVILCLLAALGVGGIIVYRQVYLQKHQSDYLRISGNIELVDIDVSFRLAGRVERRVVSEGESIQVGAVVAYLETRELDQERSLRKAEEAVAVAALAELEAGTRPEEIAQGEAVLSSAEAQSELSKLQWERQQKLYSQEIVPTREYELAQASYQVDIAKVKEAQERLQLLKKGPRIEVIEQAKARLQQAQVGVELANTRISYATITSPLSGLVLEHHVESGEFVAPGTPVVTVGDLTQVWLRAYVDEADLGKVKLGQKVLLRNDTFPDKVYEGTVSFISSEAEFTPKNVQTFQERVKLVYRIKVDVNNPHLELKPGMPVDGDVVLYTDQK